MVFVGGRSRDRMIEPDCCRACSIVIKPSSSANRTMMPELVFLRMHPARQAERPRKDSNAPLIGPSCPPTMDQRAAGERRADCRASHSASGKSTRLRPDCPDAETRSATIDHLVVRPPRPPAWSQWGNDAVRREARKATWKWDAGTGSGAPGDVSSTTRGKKQQAAANSLGVFPPSKYVVSLASITVFPYGALRRTPGAMSLGQALETPTPLGAFSVLLPARAELCSPGSSLAAPFAAEMDAPVSHFQN